VTGFEIDPEAIAIGKDNVDKMELTEIVEFFNADISQLNFKHKKYFDTIIMNPPFGTRKEGIDMVFLKKALEVNFLSKA
jgi:rRNA N6-adenosine-methyltransferase METTL5